MGSDNIILQPDAAGRFSIPSLVQTDVEKIDISDVDIVISGKNGEHFILPGGGVAAMGDHPPDIIFANGVAIPISRLLGEVGAVLSLAAEVNMPSSIKLDKPPVKQEDQEKQQAELAKHIKHLQEEQQKLAHELQQKEKVIHQQEQQIQQQTQQQIEQQQKEQQQQDQQHDKQNQVSALTVNTEATVEQLVQQVEKIQDNLHKSDYDYTPPHQYQPPPSPVASPAGVPPPISMTPLVTLYVGNVVGTTIDTTSHPGFTYIYGGGGAEGSGAISQLGPRDALQFSAASIQGTDGDDVIYTGGPLVGNPDPIVDRSYNAKEFMLNVAGYFTTLDDITISGLPPGVMIIGATDNGGGKWTLPSSYVIHANSFAMYYSMDLWRTSGSDTFDMSVEVSGQTSRHNPFHTTQTFRFRFMDVTDPNQSTDPRLVYDDHGLSKQIYLLPTMSQPNIIHSGEGNDTIYGSRNDDTIISGNGDNHIYGYAGNNNITAGNGDNVITTGDGNNTISLGNGLNAVTTGSGDDIVTTAGGGGTIDLQSGDNAITINSTAGSTDIYTLTTTGSGTNTITAGDDLYVISMGSGTNTVTLGNGTDAYNTQIAMGDGTNTVTTGNGRHTIVMGAGVSTVATGSGNDAITTAGGGGTINAGSGDNTIVINSAAGSTDLYNLTTTGTGTNAITAGDGLYNISMGDGTNNVALGNGSSSNNTQITLGAGTNAITAGDGLYVISAGDGTNSIALGNGTNAYNSQITLGAGTNLVTTGNGRHTISVGAGTSTITTSSGNDTITTAGGGGTIDAQDGDNAIAINSTAGSLDLYTVTTTGTGTNTITSGDDLYIINMGAGTNTVVIGSGSDAFDTQITTGNGTNSITTGNGQHTIITGAGVSTITTGSGNDAITTAGGGGSINAGSGNNAIVINSSAGSTDSYILTTTGAGSSTITGGDDNYTITLGSGINSVSIGNSSTTSRITATGNGANTITAGNGDLIIAAGAGGNVISTGTGTVSITSGDGNDTITTNGGGGTINAANGTNNITVTTGNYTITTGANNDTIIAGNGNNTINVGAGTNAITVGNGNNTLVGTDGNDTFVAGSGNNVFRTGLGTNSVSGSSETNTMDFSDITTTSVTVTVGSGAAHGTATGTGLNNDLFGISTIIGSNMGDNITLTGGDRTVYAGSGNDTIRAGSGIAMIYAGNGNNTIYGGTGTAQMYGGTGNNTFLTPAAGTYYNGTNGQALSSMPNNLAYSFLNGATTVNLYLNTQINTIDYSSDNTSMTVNLLAGMGSGGRANGSSYAFTPTNHNIGYSSINKIIFGNGTDSFTPSCSDTIIIGGNGTNYVYDSATLATQNVTIVTGRTGGTSYLYMGLAHETIVGSAGNYVYPVYSSSPAGIVVNLSNVNRTFTSSLYAQSVTVAAYSGTNWGLTANDANSWSTGDYFMPISGTNTYVARIDAPNYNSIVYAGSSSFMYYGNSASDYFFGGTAAGSTYAYYMSAGNDAFVAGLGTNIFYAYNYNQNFNISVVLDKSLDTRPLTATVNLTWGGTTYTGFAYGYGNANNPNTSPITRLSGVKFIVGYGGSDYIVGDNNGDQINARGGANTIITGSGADIITIIEGSNTINAGTDLNNTLNFETLSNAYSGVLAGYSAAATAGVEAFLANGNFFSTGAGGDQAAFWGGTLPFNTRVTSGANKYYSTIQTVDNANGLHQSSIQNLNGGDYSSGTSGFDHVLYGDGNANVIRGYGGGNIIAGGGGADSLYGGSNGDIFYETPTQLASALVINGGAGADTLRCPGWGATTAAGNAFGATSPFSSSTPAVNTACNAKFVGIETIDVRVGTDTINTTGSSLTITTGSTVNAVHPTYYLSALDIQNIVDAGNGSILTLKLDSGDNFLATLGAGTGALSAVQNPVHTGTDTTWRFYSNAGHVAYDATNLVATVNIHLGA